MARNRKKNEPLIYQVQKTPKAKLAIGESKEKDILLESYRLREKKKYSCCLFVKWCKQNYNCKTLEECKPYVMSGLLLSPPFPHQHRNHTYVPLQNYITVVPQTSIPFRHRKDITRSRHAAKRDNSFSMKNYKELINFCKGTGLRKSELECLRVDQLLFKNGHYYIAVTRGAKGGRYREAPIISSVEAIVTHMRNAGNDKVWNYVPDLDILSYRSEYCCEIYRRIARPQIEIPKKERYICRCDLLVKFLF